MTEATVRDQEDFRDFLMEKGASIALMTNSWKARDSAQLTASKNEHVEILDDARNWWSVRNRHGLVGYIPCTFVRKIIYEKVGFSWCTLFEIFLKLRPRFNEYSLQSRTLRSCQLIIPRN